MFVDEARKTRIRNFARIEIACQNRIDQPFAQDGRFSKRAAARVRHDGPRTGSVTGANGNARRKRRGEQLRKKRDQVVAEPECTGVQATQKRDKFSAVFGGDGWDG